jgi:tRNA-Thr(GGU) m(6)t(6)A37 methyltransferase TsaA
MKTEESDQNMGTKGELRFVGIVEKTGEEKASIRIYPEFCAGLKGISDFSHLIVLYWIHLRDNEEERRTLLVFPKRHAWNVETGVFAARSPSRPNPIGFCVVELLKVEDCVLTVQGLDALENSPIADIKPYIPRADAVSNAKVPEWTQHGPKT